MNQAVCVWCEFSGRFYPIRCVAGAGAYIEYSAASGALRPGQTRRAKFTSLPWVGQSKRTPGLPLAPVARGKERGIAWPVEAAAAAHAVMNFTLGCYVLAAGVYRFW